MEVKEISSETLVEWQQSGENFKLIDIREHSEMRQGMIPQGVSQPMATIAGELDRYQREETIVVYCRSGIRSFQVCDFMQKQGFTNVINLSGGIMAWGSCGLETVTPSENNLQACL